MPFSARPVVNRTFAPPALLLAATLLLASGCKSAPPPESVNPQNTPVAAPQINGQDVVTLQRKATQDGAGPEFLSATVIPGRGMNLFQITANLPGKGTTNVFFAPSLDDAKTKLSGTDPADKFGNGGVWISAAHSWCSIQQTASAASSPTTSNRSSPIVARQDPDRAGQLLRQEAWSRSALDPRADPYLENRRREGGRLCRWADRDGHDPCGRLRRPLAFEDGSRLHHRARRQGRYGDHHGEECGRSGGADVHRLPASLLRDSERRPHAGEAPCARSHDGAGQQL